MLKPRHFLLLSALMVAGLLVNGCKDDNPTAVAADAMPDFSLPDVNPTSATYDQKVSPRDHLQHVSAWYFGHAT